MLVNRVKNMTQEYKKGTGTGRGGWRGGGRPVGTKKENSKKMYSFRLSEEELKAVREILAKMCGKLVLLFCLLSFILPCGALTLEGSVEYTEETARTEAFKNLLIYYPYENTRDFNRSLYIAQIETSSVLNIQEFHTKLFNTIPFKLIGVQYKENPNFIYYYKKQGNGYQCLVIDVIKQDKDNIKAYKYNAKTGKIVSVGFSVSNDEEFVYNANQELIAHWIGDTEKMSNYKRFIKYSEQ